MDIYSQTILMQKTRELARDYLKSTGEVLPISTHLAKFDIMHLLNFKNPITKEVGVDLIGVGSLLDQKIQIKSRLINETSKTRPMVGQININANWEHILLVIYNSEYAPQEIYILSKSALVQEQKSHPKSLISVAKFKAIGIKCWPEAADVAKTLIP